MLVARAGRDEEGRKNSRIEYSDGVYEGEIMGGKHHGNGTGKWTNGNEYVGEWEDGMMHGDGTFKDANGSEYVGGWKNDKRHGDGTIKYADGDVYTGEWVNNNRHGKGTCKYADGDVYTGEWVNDKQHGNGTCKYANGDVYEGGWKNDKMDGKGRYTRADGEIYIGKYEDDCRHGTGKLKEAGSDAYSEVVYNQGKLVRNKRMAPIVNSPPAKRCKLQAAAVSARANTEIPELETQRDSAVESKEPEHIIVKSAAVDSSTTCKENTAGELIDEPVATTAKYAKETANNGKIIRSATHEAGGDEVEERKVQDEGPSNPNVQAELRVCNNNPCNIAPRETEKDDVKDGKAEEDPPAQSLEEPDTLEDDSVNEHEVKFDYMDICKKLTVKVETQKAKMEGMKAEIKSLKKELARRYNTEMY